ncbi:MAG: 30S ribosomal protein S18 [Parcubacteria group bacterium CG11_big_fil_rev_8_21_14_0_20_39_22]|nr:MAG: 30S ribosomal protein S18 [Parcubacteria group bacterium CG11_big_fil_rev_8_21_14_0_20_39_22]
MKNQCFFSKNNIEHIDYKDIEVLKKFINPHGRILSRKRTGVATKNQRKLSLAIKRARFMGLLPFIAR